MENLHQDELGSITTELREVTQLESQKLQPMAFTIHFAENKDIASAKNLRESLGKYAVRHMRNSSLPNVDESKLQSGVGAVGVSPLPARKDIVTRRAGYHSEGYFSSDQEEDIRSRSELFVRKLKNMEKGLRTTNLAQEKKIMAEQNSIIKAKLMTLPDKHEFGDFLIDRNEQPDELECKQNSPLHVREAGDSNDNQVHNLLHVTEAGDVDDWAGASDEEGDIQADGENVDEGGDEVEEGMNDSSNDTVSEAGTYTIERDTPCPEVIRARQDIENVIGILKVGAGRSCLVDKEDEGSSFKMSLYREGSNWINEWASHVAKHNHETSFSKPSFCLPPLPVGKQQGPTPVSTSKIPSPVHSPSLLPPSGRKHTPSPDRTASRNLHSPLNNLTLHEPGMDVALERQSDSSLETESFLRTTESVVTAMQARMSLSMDSGGESDVDTSHSYKDPGSSVSGRPVDHYLMLRRPSNTSDGSARREGRNTHSDSSSEAGESKVKRKEVAGPQMRYNRAFSLRRARLDCENDPPGDKKKKATNNTEETSTITSKQKKSFEPAKVTPSRTNKVQNSKPETFSRTDCGRFSVRAPKVTPQALLKPGGAKKDTKKHNSGGRSNSTLSSREVEFQNWKRRKSYDPMKAAAEGKKKEAAKKATLSTSVTQSSIADPETSPSHQNPVLRSASFHGTGGVTPGYVSSEDEVTLSADEDSPLSGCPPLLIAASPPKLNADELQTSLEVTFGGSRMSLHSTTSNSSLRGRTKMEALDSLVMAAVCGLTNKLRGSSCKLLKKLRYLYEEDSERCDKLSNMIELLENTGPPGSPKTKSPSKELSGMLKNLKRLETVFKVLDEVLFDEEDFELEVESYQRD